MPSSTRLLYYDLGMDADDDGFVEWYAVIAMTKASEQDLQVLQGNRFVTVFDDRVLIILDWKENNLIRSDRYYPSKYLKTYEKEIGRDLVYQNPTSGIPEVDQRYTQVRVGKERLEESPVGDSSADEEKEMRSFWKENAGTTLRNNVPENLRAYHYLRDQLAEQLSGYLVAARAIRADEYQKRTLQAKLTNFVGLRESLEQVESYMLAHVDDRAGTFSTSDISKL